MRLVRQGGRRLTGDITACHSNERLWVEVTQVELVDIIHGYALTFDTLKRHVLADIKNVHTANEFPH